MHADSSPTVRISEKHPLAIRWFHWLNFPLLSVMIWSGLLIYWSNSIYQLRIFGHNYFHFFPKPFFEKLGIPFRLADGLGLHFFFMWLFTVNGIVYVLYTFFSGEWRYLLPDRHCLKQAFQVVLHDLHLRKTMPPQIKYNAAQRIAYTLIVIMGAGSVITGLAIYKPLSLRWLSAALGGYEWTRWEHFWLTVGYVLFFVIHIAQVIRAGWNNFRGMVSGYERLPQKTEAPLGH